MLRDVSEQKALHAITFDVESFIFGIQLVPTWNDLGSHNVWVEIKHVL